VPAILRFDAALEGFKGVTRSIEVREDQTLVDLHDGIQEAFGWMNDHLYSFWLDGRFWGDRSSEYTAPFEPDEDVASADVVISELGLEPGAKIAYVFDFGDDWQVALRLAGRADGDGERYPRVVASEGEAPPQYPDPDDDQDGWLEGWEAADRQAAGVVVSALSGQRGDPVPAGALAAAAAQLRAGLSTGEYPYSWMRSAAGLGRDFPTDDAELMLRIVAATISPQEDTGLEPGEEASIVALEHGDWAGAVIELARHGPGASADPAVLVEASEACPEIEGPPSDPGETAVTDVAFELLGLAWEAAGILDDEHTLTPLGAWVLPRALTWAWGMDFDSGEPRAE
jgi:hypothetical protein